MYELRRMIRLDVLNLIKNPVWVLYVTLFPILLVVILSFVGGTGTGNEMSSADYFGLTMMVFAALQSSSFAANSFMEERIKLPNMRIIMLPVPDYFIPLSKIIATLIFTVLFYTIDGWLLSQFFAVNFGGQAWPAVWGLLVTVDFFAVVFGILFCTLFKSESMANQFTSLLTQSLAILSGCFFPIYILGEKVAAISYYSPITRVIHTLFELIYDGNYQHYASTIIIVLVLSILCGGVSLKLFKGEDYL